MIVIETGSPPSSAVFYVSAATIQCTTGPQVSTVNQITYNAVWPARTWPPTGVVELA
jgi:hypothetical protein